MFRPFCSLSSVARAALLAALAATANAQSDDPDAPPRPVAQETAWPELSKSDAKHVQDLIGDLRSEKEPLRAAADEALRAFGAGAAPALFRRLTDNKRNFNDAILSVLGAVVEPKHADLLAVEATNKKKAVLRRFATRRLATYHDPGLREALAGGLDDKDETVQFHCATGLVGLADHRGLDIVFERARKDWDDVAPFYAEVLPGGRSRAMSDAVLTAMHAGNASAKIAGLRLLRSLLPQADAGRLGGYLDSDEAALRKEVINTLRVVVDGDPPLDKLSVFQAIEMAKKWKERL